MPPPGYGFPTQKPPLPRSGPATAASVLAYVQAGFVLIASIGVVAAGFAPLDTAVFFLAVGVIQLVGAGLLITGGVQVALGINREVLLTAIVIQYALCVAWIAWAATATEQMVAGLPGAPDDGMTVAMGLVFYAFLFAVMPSIALGLSFAGSVRRRIAARKATQPQF